MLLSKQLAFSPARTIGQKMTNLKDKKIISLTNSSDWKHPIRSKASNTSGNQTETRDQYRARTHISLSYCISSLIHQSQNSRSGFYLCQNVRVFNSSIPTIQIPISQYRKYIEVHSQFLTWLFLCISQSSNPAWSKQGKCNDIIFQMKWQLKGSLLVKHQNMTFTHA